jgi:hypothetical protein
MEKPISIASNRQSEALGGDKLKKVYVRLMSCLETCYGRYRVSREGPWIEYLAKMEMEQIKKTLAYLESGASEHTNPCAPRRQQFYALWQSISRKKTPDDIAKDDEKREMEEEGRQMIWNYLLAAAAASIDGSAVNPRSCQTEASLRDYFHRSGLHLPEEVKNLVMDKIRPLTEESVLELAKRYSFWMSHARTGMIAFLNLE